MRLAGALTVVLVLVGVSLTPLFRRDGGEGRVLVGSKTFTEQYVLAEVLRATIEGRTGLRTEAAQSLGSTVAFDALRTGAIDVYVDYSGTLWTTVMRREDAPSDRGTMLEEIRRELRASHGIVVVGALGFENAYALATRRGQAEALGLRTISDLVPVAPRLSLGGDYEFFARPEWRALETRYGLRPRSRRSMDSSLMYQAAQLGEVDVISAFTTDGRIRAMDLVVLTDDRGAIPPYDALILSSASLAERHPEAIAALATLEGTIDADRMRAMNLAVDRDHVTPRDAARAFVARRHAADADGQAPLP